MHKRWKKKKPTKHKTRTLNICHLHLMQLQYLSKSLCKSIEGSINIHGIHSCYFKIKFKNKSKCKFVFANYTHILSIALKAQSWNLRKPLKPFFLNQWISNVMQVAFHSKNLRCFLYQDEVGLESFNFQLVKS